MNIKEASEVMKRVKESCNTIGPVMGLAYFGYILGEYTMQAGSLGGFAGTFVGAEALAHNANRLRQDLRVATSTNAHVLTESMKRRII